MRYSNMTDNVLLALLVAGFAATAACSSGSDSPTPGAGGSANTGGGSTNTGGGSTNTGGGSTNPDSGSTGTGGSTNPDSGSTGTGGSGGTVISPTSVCYNATKTLDVTADPFVDDFEEADKVVLGGWYAFNDVTPTNSIKPTIVAGGAATTAQSLEYTATGVKSPTAGGFGAGLVWGLLPPSFNCVDVSAFDGVSFWAKLGTATGVNAKIYFKVATPETNASKAVEATGIGDCAGPTGCYNPPNKIITLTGDWTQYAVKWGDLTGGSLPTGKPKWVGLAQQLVWTSDGPALDFFLDEIAFFKGTAPTGPVKP